MFGGASGAAVLARFAASTARSRASPSAGCLALLDDIEHDLVRFHDVVDV
jgi:hypothetical protein